ncbi:RHS repeat-associated core domain-containing protein, partial [Chitinophaga costaii]
LPKVGEPLQYNYSYDLLNRIIGMQTIRNLNVVTNNWTPVAVSDFGETVTYDPNGNILHYNRNGNATWAGQSLNMDQMHYNYLAGTNKLDNIKDDVDLAAYTTDIDSQADGNYDYDAIGNLVKDQQSSIDDIKWTVYGKISDIHKTTGTATTIHYTYDGSGNRISKTVNGVLTWYVRDATGNVMSIYTRGDNSVNTGHLTQIETDIYGSSRLGIDESKKDLEEAGATDNGVLFNFQRGEKVYELGNHLGNVLSTIGDVKLPGSSNGNEVVDYTPKVQSAGDYYPFGMQEPGRTFSSAGYRYGFNGKENDNEIYGEGNAYDFGERIQDPRIGRWLSVDPLQAKYPNESPYNFCLNSPIAFKDGDGRDAILITFPDYRIDPEIKIGTWKAPKVGGLGHAGIMIIDNNTGRATYYEYGRYKTTDGTKGLVRKYDVGKIVFGKDGKATEESVNAAMGKISQKSGEGGRIKGAYVISDKFKEMKDYADQKYNESNPGNPQYDANRPPYSLLGNNCGTFAADVVNQDPNVDQPSIYTPTPKNIVSEYVEEGNAEVLYDPTTKKTTIGEGDESDAKKDGNTKSTTNTSTQQSNNSTRNKKATNTKSSLNKSKMKT